MIRFAGDTCTTKMRVLMFAYQRVTPAGLSASSTKEGAPGMPNIEPIPVRRAKQVTLLRGGARQKVKTDPSIQILHPLVYGALSGVLHTGVQAQAQGWESHFSETTATSLDA